MQSVNKYPENYIHECKEKVEVQIQLYKNLLAKLKKQEDVRLDKAVIAFETHFCNNMVIVLDGLFMDRSRTVELKDGNPSNEVRMLCASIKTNNNNFILDDGIRYTPDKSILKLKFGDEIKLSIHDFLLLSSAYFTDIASKF